MFLIDVSGLTFRIMFTLALAASLLFSFRDNALADGLTDCKDASGKIITTDSGCQISFSHWASKYITAASDYKASWFGTCTLKAAEGTGKLIVTGSFGFLIFTGSMVNGTMEGQGSLQLPSAETLAGVFHIGSLEGRVSYTRPDGFRYEGDWAETAETGHGNALYPDWLTIRW